MVPRLSILLLIFAAIGCGANEAPAPVDTPAQRAAVEQSASQAWTAEKQEAYRNAMQRAKSGQEGSGVAPSNSPSGSTGGGVMAGGVPNMEDPDAPAYPVTQSGSSTGTTTQPSGGSGMPSGRPNEVGTTGSDPMVGK